MHLIVCLDTWVILIWGCLASVHVVLVIFIFLVYGSNGDLGSPKKVFEKLTAITSTSQLDCSELSGLNQACGAVNGNYGGSFLTMLSSGGFIFGIINIIGNFGTVFVDNVSEPFKNQSNIVSRSSWEKPKPDHRNKRICKRIDD